MMADADAAIEGRLYHDWPLCEGYTGLGGAGLCWLVVFMCKCHGWRLNFPAWPPHTATKDEERSTWFGMLATAQKRHAERWLTP